MVVPEYLVDVASRNRHWASRMETPQKRLAGASPRTAALEPHAKRVALESESLPTTSGSDLPSLDDDIIAKIFRLVGEPKSLASLSLVSKRWRDSLSTCVAWRMICHEMGNAPRRPRKPWRDIHLDALRRQREQAKYQHELLLLRVTTNPKKSTTKSNEGVGALRLDRPKQLRKLLEQIRDDNKTNLDVNHQSVTYGGRTLLGVAARLGSFHCAKELLTHWNADANSVDDEGWTPLMEAAFRGNEGIAVWLRECGAVNDGFAGARADAILPLTADEREDGEKNIELRKKQKNTKRTAVEWATVRGNHRLRTMIDFPLKSNRPEFAFARGMEEDVNLVKNNVTPFTI